MANSVKDRVVRGARRIVVKLGSSVITDGTSVDRDRIAHLTAELARAHDDGREIVVVTSGARAAGLRRLRLRAMPARIPEQQAAAAIGQIRLMALYEECFATFNCHIGQVLLTASDIQDKARYLNAKHTFEHLLAHRIVPVVNENDSVAIEELKFGDNDRLAALVASLIDADLLILLTDVGGLYDRNPRKPGAELVRLVEDADVKTFGAQVTAESGSAVGTGGMASKLEAVRYAARCGIPSLIANGRTDGVLTALLDPACEEGTLFTPSASQVPRRKAWIAHGTPVKGRLFVDAGAQTALAERGGSLLPKGITAISGNFEAGDCVACIGPDGGEFARGLVAYDASDCERIRGRASTDIEAILGYHIGDEVIHRDDLALTSPGSDEARK